MSSATAVGFIGLGTMGEPMAINLQRHVGSLTVWDCRTDAPSVARARAAGASVAESASDIGRRCGVIVMCVPDSRAVEEVLYGGGHGGLAAVVDPTTLLIDCSTTHPSTSQRAAATLMCDFIDAPITGEQTRAEAGTLTCMVGGSDVAFRRAAPILAGFASRVVHVGGHGHGQLAKALNNCLYNVSVAAMAECLPLAQKSGLDVEAFARVVAAGTGQSFGFCKFAPLVMARAFGAPQHGYPMGAAFKDMEVVADAADAVGADLCVVSAARRTYEEALRSGLAREHKGAMVKVWEQRMGTRVVPKQASDGGGDSGDGRGGGGDGGGGGGDGGGCRGAGGGEHRPRSRL